MKLQISYGVVFGKCDSSDPIEYNTIELSEEEAKAAIEFALTDNYDAILKLDELQETYSDLYNEIEDMEIENNLEKEDEYTMECQGTAPMDEDELNELVHSKDAHALEFFKLNDADDEEIEEWNAAYDLDEIPTVAEFTPEFEPVSPYDQGWILNVFVTDVEASEEEIVSYIKILFTGNDIETINEIKSNCTLKMKRNIKDIIMDVAKEICCQEYIDSQV